MLYGMLGVKSVSFTIRQKKRWRISHVLRNATMQAQGAESVTANIVSLQEILIYRCSSEKNRV